MRKPRRQDLTSKVFQPPPSKYLVLTVKRLAWIVIGLVSLAFAGWFLFGGYFTVQSISCKQDAKECDEQVKAELGYLKGTSLLTFRADKLVAKLKKADPAIEEVLLDTKLPNSLLVQIKTRDPQVLLKTPGSSEALIADSNGLIFANAKPQDSWLPTIVSQAFIDLSLGQKISDPAVLSAIKLATTLRQNFIAFQEIQINSDNLNVILSEQTRALFSRNQDYSTLVNSLQRILSQVTIDDKPITIDLRHKKPFVTFD